MPGAIRRCFKNRPEAEDDLDTFHLALPRDYAVPFLLEAELRELGYSLLPCKPGRFS